MGRRRTAAIEAFCESADIHPARGDRLSHLDTLSHCAYHLIQIVELEKCGIRDGDGYWSGTDVLGGAVESIGRVFAQLRMADKAAP